MTQPSTPSFDTAAAVTRSMLGWGVVAGPFYVLFGLILAIARPGFDVTRDALSLLLLGDQGWWQWANLVLSGLMTVVAAIGLSRTPGRPRAAAALVGLYGLCLMVSAMFPPDPTAHFPPGGHGGESSPAGLLHLLFGGLGFVAIGVAAIVAGSWLTRLGTRGTTWSRIAGVIVIVGFAAGGALSAGPAGVGLIWLAVLVSWTWLAWISITAYRAVPHPVVARR